MERIVYMARLRADKVEDYKQAHKNVWVELIKEASQSGIKNHGCFLRGRDLIIYLETQDYEKTQKEFAAKDVTRRWDQYMAEFFDPMFPSQELEPWEEVFHMD
jgi:L-rhamnose mutarotase